MNELQEAMTKVGFTATEQETLWTMLAGVIHSGDLAIAVDSDSDKACLQDNASLAYGRMALCHREEGGCSV